MLEEHTAGTVRSSPTGLDCGSACTGRFTAGSSVTLTATPNDGLTFLHWGGGCGTGTSPTATLTMGTSDLACTATFSGGTPEPLTVIKTGSGTGTVTSAPGGVLCGSACVANFAQGTSVTLTAAPTPGSRFAGWSGDCSTGGAVTMSAARGCTATFVRTYTLTVSKTGPGAAESLVTTLPAGIACGATCAAAYDTGTSVTLNAEPAEGYEFAGWSGTGCSTGTVLVDQARSCTATFAAIPPPGCDEEARAACRGDVGWWNEETCTCDYNWLDPLVIRLDGHPVRLTSVAGGVLFDINGDGVRERVAWTVAGAPVGFLALDRDGDGAIDGLGEIFGQVASGERRPEGAANSFADLAAFDRPENGGNGDGAISPADAVFGQLRLWVDADHDGVSQPGELLTLVQAGITSIELTAQPVGRRDAFGNYFKYRAVVHLADGGRRTAWDVFLVARLNGDAPASAATRPWSGEGGPGPVSAGLAGLGVAFMAVGLVGLRRTTRRHGPSPLDRARGALSEGPARPSRRAGPCGRPGPFPLFTPVRTSLTGVTTMAVVLLWPSATFGQAPQVVEYYDTDALGSVRAVTNAQGQVIAWHDFLPFGEELTPQTTDKKLFTGQERDFETGQDYFNARQLRPDLGKFLTPDPALAAPLVLRESQRLNLYAYALNNPLRYVDRSGQWPTFPIDVHAQILNTLFPGHPDTDALRQISQAGQWADTYLADPDHAYAHAMSDGTVHESPGVAQSRYEGWVSYCIAQAKRRNSAWYLGLAIHAIGDSHSPAHEGFQPWNGSSLSHFAGNSLHVFNERSLNLLTDAEWQAMGRQIQDAIFEALGATGYMEATGYLYSRPITSPSTGLPSYTPTMPQY